MNYNQVEYIADQLDLDPLDPMYRTFSKIFQAREKKLRLYRCQFFLQAFKIVDPEDEKKMAEDEVTSQTIFSVPPHMMKSYDTQSWVCLNAWL